MMNPKDIEYAIFLLTDPTQCAMRHPFCAVLACKLSGYGRNVEYDLRPERINAYNLVEKAFSSWDVALSRAYADAVYCSYEITKGNLIDAANWAAWSAGEAFALSCTKDKLKFTSERARDRIQGIANATNAQIEKYKSLFGKPLEMMRCMQS